MASPPEVPQESRYSAMTCSRLGSSGGGGGAKADRGGAAARDGAIPWRSWIASIIRRCWRSARNRISYGVGASPRIST